jgi:hypothetical protein
VHAVVAHLEAVDAGVLALARFDLQQVVRALSLIPRSSSSSAVVARRDDAAVADDLRRVVDQRPVEKVHEVGKVAE